MARYNRGIARAQLDPYSEQARFPTLFDDRVRDLATAGEQLVAAQGAPSGSIAARENPMRWGSIFQRENPGIFNAIRESQAAQYQRGLDRFSSNMGSTASDRTGESPIDRYARGMGYGPGNVYNPKGAGTYANPYGTESALNEAAGMQPAGIARAPMPGVTGGAMSTAPMLPKPPRMPKPPKPFDLNYAPSLEPRMVGGVPTYGDRYGD